MNSADTAEEYFRKGATCSQAVLLTHCNRFGMDARQAANCSLGLGGGVARMREVCGCVSALAMLAGLKHGNGNPSDQAAKKRTYEEAQRLAHEFKEHFGSCICRELLAQRATAKAAADTSPNPGERTAEYYRQSHSTCLDCIRFAASLADSL